MLPCPHTSHAPPPSSQGMAVAGTPRRRRAPCRCQQAPSHADLVLLRWAADRVLLILPVPTGAAEVAAPWVCCRGGTAQAGLAELALPSWLAGSLREQVMLGALDDDLQQVHLLCGAAAGGQHAREEVQRCGAALGRQQGLRERGEGSKTGGREDRRASTAEEVEGHRLARGGSETSPQLPRPCTM